MLHVTAGSRTSSGGVRSKVGSMDNATHTPGGGNVSKPILQLSVHREFELHYFVAKRVVEREILVVVVHV